ncbi:hypothetical protein [Oryzobacter telluris]|uniref:hypothetical protein n=1 Tax=Oryzobacter telluris TaxID=3149179 RepID=UPI00370D2DB3
MPLLRTSLTVLALGGATLTTALVATSATSAGAAPAPVAAVEAALPAVPVADATSAAAPARAARGWWKDLTDTQQACLKKEVGSRPVGPLSVAERTALREKLTKAADACDVELPFARARAFWDSLTDEQRTCLREADVQRPWGPLTDAERKAVRADLAAAAKECGVSLPARSSARS